MSTTDFGHYWDDEPKEGLKSHSTEKLLEKCQHLKGIDGEAWFIADLFEKWLNTTLSEVSISKPDK